MKRRKITARRGKEGESEEALKRAKAGGGEKGIQTKTGRRKEEGRGVERRGR